jgi:geranylgeranyl diphosphate synthase type II
MDLLEQINSSLVSLSNDWPELPVCEAAKYSLLGGGKRIRPVLAIEAFKLVGGVGDAIMPYACALEFIHTSSLIMDDIMDGHKVRRDRLACYIKYGSGTALMASQFICSEAYLLIKNPRCLHEILTCVREMCIGQAEEIAELKTGSLIRTAIQIGGIIGGASEEELVHLGIFGLNIGYLFQVRDDILDGERPDEKLELDLSCLDIFGEKAENLRQIARFIVERTK